MLTQNEKVALLEAYFETKSYKRSDELNYKKFFNVFESWKSTEYDIEKNYCQILAALMLAFLSVAFSIYSNYMLADGQDKRSTPVILRDAASRIDVKLNKQNVPLPFCKKHTDDYVNLWMDEIHMLPPIIYCWIDSIRLVYDDKTRRTYNAPGVETKIPYFGDTKGVDTLDPRFKRQPYFKPISDALVSKKNYVRGVSVRGAPYDFRKASYELEQWFVDFQNLVEETYKLNGQSPVLLVSHSMGSKMTLHFLQTMTQSWKDTYISSWVSLCGAFGGSMKVMKSYTIGEQFGIPLADKHKLREAEISFSSMASLIPSPLFWGPDETLVQTASRNYSISNLGEFFKDVAFVDGWDMRRNTLEHVMNFTAPGVEVHCIVGSHEGTVERLIFKINEFPSGKVDFEYGEGDGTVNKRSLDGCLRWNNTQTKKVHYRIITNTNHVGILNSDEAIGYILLLVDKSLPN